MNQNIFKETDDYKSSKIQKLWYDLSIAMNHVKPGESIIQRRSSPWNSEDEEIKAAWNALTSPENLELLKAWSQQKMNAVAAEATAKAIAHCIRRLEKGN
jgi:hypothetical protein